MELMEYTKLIRNINRNWMQFSPGQQRILYRSAICSR